MPSAATTAHQLKIQIDGIRPPVWRRVLVPSGIARARLHQVIQQVFGWWDYHLHEFEIDGVRYGIDDGEGWGDPPLDERRTKLAKVAAKGSHWSQNDHTLDQPLDMRGACAAVPRRFVLAAM